MLRYAEQRFVICAFLEPVWLSPHSAQNNRQARRIFSREQDLVPSSGAMTMTCTALFQGRSLISTTSLKTIGA